ncbi:MAG: bifunctional (p)ppGpp synthetase/guanosine-3',5'-bis(diphosphate) 3'-pyrophosphohydrolase [Clostridiales bacterium]|nr:bifunctional (p)ppGpp synthetase/guanosine-3',5'-bis(diphosphate) 3'-pyrophosphohydrolase [Clostridiales bacterium]
MKLNYALRFAFEKHKGQKRKLTGEDYYFHPVEVALIVAQYTNDVDTIIAAVLHDTLEDTDTAESEIRNIFGDNVLNIILECSEKDKTLEWKDRKSIMLDSYPTLSESAFLIILVDKICNLNSIKYYYSDHVWDYFNADEKDQKWVLTESLKILKSCPYNYPELINQFEELINIIFKDKKKTPRHLIK